jgi:hypothetical protein
MKDIVWLIDTSRTLTISTGITDVFANSKDICYIFSVFKRGLFLGYNYRNSYFLSAIFIFSQLSDLVSF